MPTLASLLTTTILSVTSLSWAVSSAAPVCKQSEAYALIQRVDPGTWSVDVTLVEVYTSDLQAAGVLAHAIPHRNAKGQRDGVLLLDVREGSPLHQAGFHRGDVVHSVDGRRLSGPVRVLRMMHDLRGADEVAVRISRDGQTLDQHYVVDRG